MACDVLTPVATGPGRWRLDVDPAWPGFAGHFPGNPLLPAAELIDCAATVMAATACELVVARFLKPVRPGDQLELVQEAAATLRIQCGTDTVAELRWRL